MSSRSIKDSMLTGVVIFILTVASFIAIEAPRPFFAGAVILFIMYEMILLHWLKKDAPPPEPDQFEP